MAKTSRPPPLPAAAPVVAVTSSTPSSAPPPAARPETGSELEMCAYLKPRSFVLARTLWFFGVLVVTRAFRWSLETVSHGRAWLGAEWKRAAIRAKAPRQA